LYSVPSGTIEEKRIQKETGIKQGKNTAGGDSMNYKDVIAVRPVNFEQESQEFQKDLSTGINNANHQPSLRCLRHKIKEVSDLY